MPSPDLKTTMFFDIPVDERNTETVIDEREYNYAIAISRGRRLLMLPIARA
jgi:hypothetical protein